LSALNSAQAVISFCYVIFSAFKAKELAKKE